MRTQRFLLFADHVSTWSGKISAWIILLLTASVCVEVFKRYILNAPTAWIFSAEYMMYGTMFMMAGAYTLAQNGHVRGDFLYGSMRPRNQAYLDLLLYIVFFLPGISALLYAGWDFAHASWVINEHVSDTADGPPLYPFKMIIPIAGALVLLLGFAEIVRCVICIRTGVWPARLTDVEEIDVVGEQLAQSEFVDEESRRAAIAGAHEIDAVAHARGAERASS
jgi:TRAP-type mannitol/chloroaromatic compound transport system permease small subunit